MRKNEKLVEIVIVLCSVFLMTLFMIAAELKFHKHSSIFGAPLLLLLNEWFERHHTFYLWRSCSHSSPSNVMRGMRRKMRGSCGD